MRQLAYSRMLTSKLVLPHHLRAEGLQQPTLSRESTQWNLVTGCRRLLSDSTATLCFILRFSKLTAKSSMIPTSFFQGKPCEFLMLSLEANTTQFNRVTGCLRLRLSSTATRTLVKSSTQIDTSSRIPTLFFQDYPCLFRRQNAALLCRSPSTTL